MKTPTPIPYNFRQKAMDLHEDVNHSYAGYNYILHLDAVNAVKNEFEELYDFEVSENSIYKAVYYHDTLEDCNITYNQLKSWIGEIAAEIVYAVTNNKGRTRAERANADYYLNIRKTPGATFVKMCDRIANVRFSRMMGSSMYEKYKDENDHFMVAVGADQYPEMKECLINLFK